MYTCHCAEIPYSGFVCQLIIFKFSKKRSCNENIIFNKMYRILRKQKLIVKLVDSK